MIRLPWEACYNVRDLGGYRTESGGETRVGRFVRSDSLHRLTPAGLDALCSYGVKTIVDLRDADECERDASPFANGRAAEFRLRYENIPFSANDDPDVDPLFERSKTVLETYRLVLGHKGRNIARIMTSIAEAQEGAVLWHCHAGRDRTGIVAALLLSLAGVPRQVIVEDYTISDVFLERLNAEYAATLPEDHQRRFEWELAHVAQTMEGSLDYLHERYGTAEGYLRSIGVREQLIADLKHRLVQA